MIPFLGKPAEGLDEMGYIYWTFDSGESVLGIAALVENNEFIFGLKSKGRINAICYRDDIRKRAAGLLMLVILAGLTINYLLVWLLERWRIRKAPLQAVPQP
ncbi:MAG: hypothetical protein M5U26_22180 [Planctomycetota bacterium]|nr:hypothetical protein [Planctomycetota bacterium]